MKVKQDSLLTKQSSEYIEQLTEKLDRTRCKLRIRTSCCDVVYDAQYVRFLMPWENRFSETHPDYPDFTAFVVIQRAGETPTIPTIGVLEIRESSDTLLWTDHHSDDVHEVEGFAEVPDGKTGVSL